MKKAYDTNTTGIQPLRFTFRTEEKRPPSEHKTQLICPYVIEDLSDIDISSMDILLIPRGRSSCTQQGRHST